MRWRRALRFWWQRRTRGWDDSDTWCLDAKIARWALPRLRRFRELKMGHPGDLTPEGWEHILDELIWFMEVHASEDGTWEVDMDRSGLLQARYEQAGRWLGQYFGHLWW